MDKDIKEKLIEISNDINGISKNLNGNRKRTIKELEKLKNDIEEIIKNEKERKNDENKRKILITFFAISLMLSLIIGIYASISYEINGENRFIVTTKGIIIKDNLTIESPLILNTSLVIVETKPAITDNSSYSVCVNKTRVPCTQWCSLEINKGLITGCN